MKKIVLSILLIAVMTIIIQNNLLGIIATTKSNDDCAMGWSDSIKNNGFDFTYTNYMCIWDKIKYDLSSLNN